MNIKSWIEEHRYNAPTGEELEKERQEALAYEAAWRADNERLFHEDDIMHSYANCLMEKELKAMGEYIMKKYPGKKDQWVIADAVYYHYGRYYMYANRPAEAIPWFLKAIKYKQPYPYNTWDYLAAAYVETGEYDNADKWIRRIIAYYTKEGKRSYVSWSEYGKYYLERKSYERALAMFQESGKERGFYLFDKPYIARTYFGLGEFEKGFEMFKEYIEKTKGDEGEHAELALAYYNYACDLERSEQHYLKSIEAAADREDARNWNQQIYKNMSIIFANESVWDKGFHYLKLHFQHKFEGMEADMFSQIIDNRPPIEDDEMGAELYQAILNFEESPVRPGGVKHTEGLVSEKPSDEVKGVGQQGDISGLLEFGEGMSN